MFKFKDKNRMARRDTATDKALINQTQSFRRNRTFSQTNATRAGEGDSKVSTRSHVHSLSVRRRKLSGFFLIVLLSIIALLLMIINFTAKPTMVMDDILITKSVPRSKYETIIQDYLKENPFSRFLFILDEAKLTSYTSGVAPEVLSVTYKDMRSFGNNNFIVKLRKPVAGWNINGKQYYVDENGVQFDVNYYNHPEVQVIDKSGASETMKNSGMAIASKRFLSFVGQIVSVAKRYNYTVTRAILPEDTTRQLEIGIKENDFLVKLSLDRSVNDQIGDMDKAIRYFVGKNMRPNYIDVRVNDKVFY